MEGDLGGGACRICCDLVVGGGVEEKSKVTAGD